MAARYVRLLLLLVFFWQFFVGYQDVVFSPVYLGKLAIIGCFFFRGSLFELEIERGRSKKSAPLSVSW